MRGTEYLRNAAVTVIRHAMITFAEQNSFDFSSPKVRFLDKSEYEKGTLYSSKFFDEDQGIQLISRFIQYAELTHYKCLRQSGKHAYTWTNYLEDLCKNAEMSRALVLAVRNGLTKLDFEDSWTEAEIEDQNIQ